MAHQFSGTTKTCPHCAASVVDGDTFCRQCGEKIETDYGQMQEDQIGAPRHEFTLLCDDIRQEEGGKTSLMGIYDHHIVVPQVPYVLPKVCFYTRFGRMDGQYKFNFSIVNPSGKRCDIIVDSDVQIEGVREGTFNVIASPFEAEAEGVYEVIIGLVKGDDFFEYDYKFAISSGERLHQE